MWCVTATFGGDDKILGVLESRAGFSVPSVEFTTELSPAKQR
jgi:hypothetical protein